MAAESNHANAWTAILETGWRKDFDMAVDRALAPRRMTRAWLAEALKAQPARHALRSRFSYLATVPDVADEMAARIAARNHVRSACGALERLR